jgi:hypothetical protein
MQSELKVEGVLMAPARRGWVVKARVLPGRVRTAASAQLQKCYQALLRLGDRPVAAATVLKTATGT